MGRPSVLVIGAGPAGASAAAFLARESWRVAVVDRGERPGPKARLEIGESLPPDAKRLLERLGVWSEFESGPHLRCYGNVSYWAGSGPHHVDFLSHPVGHGWHLERSVFEEMLVRRAEDLGAAVAFGTAVTGAELREEGWRVTLGRDDGTARQVDYDVLVDATGRSSWLARRQGVDRLYEDRQLALVAFLRTRRGVEDSTTLVETAEHGWWYSAPIPGERLATAFLCRPDAAERRAWLDDAGWRALLSKAPHTRERVDGADGRLLDRPRFVSADSGILERVYGPGWIAVGDAALAYDPIASHGLLMAMVSARDAARALDRHLAGDEEALAAYQAILRAAFERYARDRKVILSGGPGLSSAHQKWGRR